MIREIRDTTVLNQFAARPDIAPAIGGALDFSGVDLDRTVFLFGAFGGFLFELSAPDEYEVHVMLAEAGRGSWGFAAAIEARNEMARRGCRRLWARIDPALRHLVIFTRKAGFVRAGDLPPYQIFEWRPTCRQQ